MKFRLSSITFQATDLNNESVKELSKHKNMWGLRSATGDLNRGQWHQRVGDAKIYSGDDPRRISCGGMVIFTATKDDVPDIRQQLEEM